MISRIAWALVIILAISIGLYPALYFFIDRNFGLLSSKSEELLNNIWWNAGFYLHIILGGLALLVGWTQFNPRWRNRNLQLHQQIGKLYVIAALVSSFTGFYIAIYATGGLIPSLGFIGLALAWFITTLNGYLSIRKKNEELHRRMMIYSYATCFAAVTLRIWLPLLTAVLNNFILAYSIVAWLCWIPNLIVAHQIIRYARK